jgi:hypothetical protein
VLTNIGLGSARSGSAEKALAIQRIPPVASSCSPVGQGDSSETRRTAIGTMRNLSCRRLQCDEIGSFVGGKDKNPSEEQKVHGLGSMWTGTAVDADTRQIASRVVGSRDLGTPYEFMQGGAYVRPTIAGTALRFINASIRISLSATV